MVIFSRKKYHFVHVFGILLPMGRKTTNNILTPKLPVWGKRKTYKYLQLFRKITGIVQKYTDEDVK